MVTGDACAELKQSSYIILLLIFGLISNDLKDKHFVTPTTLNSPRRWSFVKET